MALFKLKTYKIPSRGVRVHALIPMRPAEATTTHASTGGCNISRQHHTSQRHITILQARHTR